MPNTDTSPQQSAVRRIIGQNDAEAFFHPAVQSLMVGLTQIRADTAAKEKAQEIAEAPTPEFATKTRVDSSSGQTVHDIHMKNVQIGNAQEEVQNAHDEPVARTRSVFDTLRNAANLFGMPDPAGEDIPGKEKSFSGRYGLEREAGRNILGSLIHSAAIGALPQKLKESREEDLGKTVGRRRVASAIKAEDALLPTEREVDAQNRADRADRKERSAQLNSLITSGSLSSLGDDEASVLKNLGDVTPGGLRPYEAARAREAFKREHDKNEKDRRESARRTINAISEKSVQMTEDPDKYVESLPGSDKFTKQEKSLARDRVLAAQTTLQRQDKRDQRAENRDDRAANRDAQRDLQKVSYNEATSPGTSAGEILSHVGDKEFDQKSVSTSLRWKEESLTKERDKLRGHAKVRVAQINAASETSDPKVIAGYRQDLSNANTRMIEIAGDIAKLRQARGGKVATAPSAPKPTDKVNTPAPRKAKGGVTEQGGRLVYQP